MTVNPDVREVLKSGSNNFVIKTADTSRTIKVNTNARKLNSGSPVIVMSKVLPANSRSVINFSGYKTVRYTTSNKDVVSVSNKGYISTSKSGTATVKAYAVDDGDTYRFIYKITVKKGVARPSMGYYVYDVPVITDSMSLGVGKSYTVDLRDTEGTGSTAYVSSDPSVVSITQGGVMKGIKKGSSLVTATSVKNGKYYNYRFLVAVN